MSQQCGNCVIVEPVIRRNTVGNYSPRKHTVNGPWLYSRSTPHSPDVSSAGGERGSNCRQVCVYLAVTPAATEPVFIFRLWVILKRGGIKSSLCQHIIRNVKLKGTAFCGKVNLLASFLVVASLKLCSHWAGLLRQIVFLPFQNAKKSTPGALIVEIEF